MDEESKRHRLLDYITGKMNVSEFIKIASPEDLEEIKTLLLKKELELKSNKRP